MPRAKIARKLLPQLLTVIFNVLHVPPHLVLLSPPARIELRQKVAERVPAAADAHDHVVAKHSAHCHHAGGISDWQHT